MKKTSFLKRFALLIFTSLVVLACHEDYAPVGNEVIGDPNFDFQLYDLATIKAYSRKAAPVQTNNMNGYQLGIYDDPVYGLTEVNLLAQVTMAETQPFFGDEPRIESVFIEIPYYSQKNESGEFTTYTLDSVFGNSPFLISIYESKYFLRDLDPDSGFEDPQKYYSNQAPLFENFLGAQLLGTTPFQPIPQEIETHPLNPDEEPQKLSPRLRFELDTLFFKEKLLDFEGQSQLINNQSFKEHFRGIYIQVEPLDGAGSLFLFDINQALIRVNYSSADTEGNRTTQEFTLLMNAIALNTFENNMPPYIEDRLANPNTETGEPNLFVKGGAGTMTIIELFGEDADNNGVPDELELLRQNNWIINEANIVVQVNQDMIPGGDSEPERLFLYDVKNKVYLRDYLLDSEFSESEVLNYKSNHLGRLERDGSGKGKSYKFKITDYVNDLISKDSTNVVLGLVASQNVGLLTYQELQNEVAPGFKETLTSSVLCPEGTVLYGNTGDESTEIKLNIYYTELIQ